MTVYDEVRTERATSCPSLSELDILNRRIRTLEAEAARIEERLARFGPEPPQGSVLRFRYQFSVCGTWYTYTAIRVADRWYTSGPQAAGKPFTWEQLTAWWDHGRVKNLRIATQWAKRGIDA